MKPLLKNAHVKVGTFADDVSEFIEIKDKEDIDKMKIKVGGGTNFDAASKALSKRKDVNKIVFTDGVDGGTAGIKQKRKDIIWISFENRNFKPDFGKVLFVSPEQINDSMVQKPKEPERSL